MTTFGSAEEFYRQRDDRTQQCVASCSYQTRKCQVSVDPALLENPSGRAMVEVSCNLLSRWCRSVSLSLPPSEHAFGHAILKQMRDADPFGNFELRDSQSDSDLHLHVGVGVNTPHCVHINGSGWLASIGTNTSLPKNTDSQNVIGAIGSACMGAAELFKIATGNTTNRISGLFDFLANRKIDQPSHFSDIRVQRDFGRVLLVGAGSVGSAAAYCMRQLGLEGVMRVVDDDEIEVINFNRSPIFGMSNLGQKKGQAIEKFLKGSTISCTAEPILWNEFVRQGGLQQDYDIWIPVANEHDVRWSMQNNLPPLMIHASTSANWGVNFGRHIPIIEDCLACRFPARNSGGELKCSSGAVSVSTATTDAALPFLSFFAGMLITAEIARILSVPSSKKHNYAAFDFASDLNNIQTWDMLPRKGCVCETQRDLPRIRKSQFAFLTPRDAAPK